MDPLIHHEARINHARTGKRIRGRLTGGLPLPVTTAAALLAGQAGLAGAIAAGTTVRRDVT
jgi:hypothetical protein